MIGREIVQELQGGEERAEYGKRVIEDLSARLTERYGKGFSSQTLWKFRLFYQAYSDRMPILSPGGIETGDARKLSPLGIEFPASSISQPAGGESATPLVQGEISFPLGTKSGEAQIVRPVGFSPQLTWSHYRALMRVENLEARDFYEREAVAGGWDKRTLERTLERRLIEAAIEDRAGE